MTPKRVLAHAAIGATLLTVFVVPVFYNLLARFTKSPEWTARQIEAFEHQEDAAGAKAAFEEDKVVLEAVHRGMKNRSTQTTGLLLDAAANRFRAGLTALIEAEARPQVASGSL